MGKAGRHGRLLDYRKNIQTISFAKIPGELRNRIYGAVIYAAFDTNTPFHTCDRWGEGRSSLIGLDGSCTVLKAVEPYQFFKHERISPWDGFRIASGQIYRE